MQHLITKFIMRIKLVLCGGMEYSSHNKLLVYIDEEQCKLVSDLVSYLTRIYNLPPIYLTIDDYYLSAESILTHAIKEDEVIHAHLIQPLS